MKSKIVVVSGGTNKTGRAIAERLAETGARIIIADINLINAEVVVQHIISRYKTAATAISLNKTGVNSILSALKEINDTWRSVDVWINAAQMPVAFEMEDMDQEEWKALACKMEKETMSNCREVAAHMMSTCKRGIIINVVPLSAHAVSHAYENGSGGHHNLLNETRMLSEELKAQGIRLFTVAPVLPGNPSSQGPERESEYPTADDVAMLVLYCISILSMETTGEMLLLKGKKILTSTK